MSLRSPKELLEALLVKKTDAGFVQFLRYGFVGGIAFLADFGTLFGLTHFGHIHYLISALFGFCIGLAVNYWLSIRWVFNTRRMSSRLGEFLFFGAIGVVGVGLNELIMWLLTEKLGLHYTASKIGSTVVVYLWNFFARKKLVFSSNQAAA